MFRITRHNTVCTVFLNVRLDTGPPLHLLWSGVFAFSRSFDMLTELEAKGLVFVQCICRNKVVLLEVQLWLWTVLVAKRFFVWFVLCCVWFVGFLTGPVPPERPFSPLDHFVTIFQYSSTVLVNDISYLICSKCVRQAGFLWYTEKLCHWQGFGCMSQVKLSSSRVLCDWALSW